MGPDQARSAAVLGGRAASGVVAHVEHVHTTIARRSFRATGPVGVPVQVVHDAVASGVYRTVSAALNAGGWAAARLAGVVPPSGDDVGAGAAGAHLQSALNAVVGDQLARSDDPLRIELSLRHRGRDLPLSPGHLADAYPDASPNLVVFVHGLGENERSWSRASDDGSTLGHRLAEDLGVTPLFLRYNSGRHISANGRALATLLDDLVTAWPAGVERLSLVGHSMGGLVIRSACHYGAAMAWMSPLDHVVYLGSPHAGAPLARVSRVLGRLLGTLPETQPYGSALDHSPGVRDLRHGYLLDEDWQDCDQGTCLDDHGHDVPLTPQATHHTISAAVAGDGRSMHARIIGDLLVQPSSAHGRRRGRPPLDFEPDHRHHHDGLHHLDLLHHPRIHETLRDCLRGRRT